MGKRRETLDDLLREHLEARKFGDLCRRAGLRPWTVLRLRQGQGQRTHRGTILALAAALGVPEARVAAAIEASRRG